MVASASRSVAADDRGRPRLQAQQALGDRHRGRRLPPGLEPDQLRVGLDPAGAQGVVEPEPALLDHRPRRGRADERDPLVAAVDQVQGELTTARLGRRPART